MTAKDTSPPQALVLRLWHGRQDKSQDMEDWGFDGPVIGPLLGLQCTYFTTWRVTFGTADARALWGQRLGWRDWDDDVLEIEVANAMIRITQGGFEAFFGDWQLEYCPAEDTPLTLACKADLWWHQYAEQCKVGVVSS